MRDYLAEILASKNFENEEQKNEFIKTLFNSLATDMKTTKDGVLLILEKLGIFNDGKVAESVDFTKVLGFVNKLLWSSKAQGELANDLKNLAPLIDKYKDL